MEIWYPYFIEIAVTKCIRRICSITRQNKNQLYNSLEINLLDLIIITTAIFSARRYTYILHHYS